MAPITYEEVKTSSIPPAKLFKAILDDSLMPKVMPNAIKSVECIEGDGGVGSIKVITFGEGSKFEIAKHRVDGIDKDNLIYSYTVFESDAFKDSVEKASYIIKIEASADGGSICKTISTYYTKVDARISEEQIQRGKKKVFKMFKAIEAYLLANPDTCN